jgi:CubicO group peptidase (beta-lactamase class C family)
MIGTAQLGGELDDLFARSPDEGVTLAFLLVQEGEIVAERYGVQPGNLFQPEDTPVTDATPLVSWSIAKSMVHAAVGLMVGDGRLDPADPAPVPEWAGTNKAAITVLDLLEMRPGLRFVEVYVEGETSHCLDMLFGPGAGDQAAYAAALPLDHPPGTVWNYSSGTTNIVCRILGDLVSGHGAAPGEREAEMRAFLDQRLFGPVGMPDADPRFDAAGTWIGSSYVYAPARQFARFGELYLRDGMVGDEHILPAGWVDHARTVVAHDPDTGFGYGRHWWTWPISPARWPPTATKVSTWWCCPSTTPSSSTSARPTPACGTASSPASAASSTVSRPECFEPPECFVSTWGLASTRVTPNTRSWGCDRLAR